jgi:hypothetical protein
VATVFLAMVSSVVYRRVSMCQVSSSQSFRVSVVRVSVCACKDTGVVVGETTLLLDFKRFS